MGHPVQSQELQTGIWQWHIPIFATFTCANVNELAFPIDIFDRQADPFQQTQSAGIDRREAYSILLAVNTPQYTPDFPHTQDHGQLFSFGGRRNAKVFHSRPSVRSKKNLIPHKAIVHVARAACFSFLRNKKYWRSSSSLI